MRETVQETTTTQVAMLNESSQCMISSQSHAVQNFSNHIFFIDEVKTLENTRGNKKPIKHVNVECDHGTAFTIDSRYIMTICGICLRDKQP